MPKNAQAKTDKKTPSAGPRKVLKPSKANAQEDKHDARDARLALQEAGSKGSISWKKLKQELGI
jgi:hypothetical protein